MGDSLSIEEELQNICAAKYSSDKTTFIVGREDELSKVFKMSDNENLNEVNECKFVADNVISEQVTSCANSGSAAESSDRLNEPGGCSSQHQIPDPQFSPGNACCSRDAAIYKIFTNSEDDPREEPAQTDHSNNRIEGAVEPNCATNHQPHGDSAEAGVSNTESLREDERRSSVSPQNLQNTNELFSSSDLPTPRRPSLVSSAVSSDLTSPVGQPQTHSDQRELVVNHRNPNTRATSIISLNDLKPTISSSVFSFVMTLVFVLVLWLVVFMVFGSKGHAIAGIFVGLFFVGLLLNTCFLKFYFRLRLLLGMNAVIVAAEQDVAVANERRHWSQNAQHVRHNSPIKINEEPPSYATVDKSPPPYELLQYYKQDTSKSSLMLNPHSTAAACEKESYCCPSCGHEVALFGLCQKCQVKLS